MDIDCTVGSMISFLTLHIVSIQSLASSNFTLFIKYFQRCQLEIICCIREHKLCVLHIITGHPKSMLILYMHGMYEMVKL